MKYGEITLGQLSRCFQGTLVVGLVEVLDLGDFLDGLVEEVIKSGKLTYCADGAVIEQTPMASDNTRSIIRVTQNAESFSAFAWSEEEASRILKHQEQTHKTDSLEDI